MMCLSCKSLSGEKRISPGPTIYDGKYWVVEHAYPIKLLGWLVIVLKRHLEAIHGLTNEEMLELCKLTTKTIKVLHSELKTEKEYVSCFAEAEGFHHIHFHVVPVNNNYPDENRGAKSFGLLTHSEEESIPKEKIIELCNKLRVKFK